MNVSELQISVRMPSQLNISSNPSRNWHHEVTRGWWTTSWNTCPPSYGYVSCSPSHKFHSSSLQPRVFSFVLLSEVANEDDQRVLRALFTELKRIADDLMDDWLMNQLMDAIMRVLPPTGYPSKSQSTLPFVVSLYLPDSGALRKEIFDYFDELGAHEKCPLEVRVKLLMISQSKSPLEWVHYLDDHHMLLYTSSETKGRNNKLTPEELRERYLKAISDGKCIFKVWMHEYAPHVWYASRGP